MPEYIYLPLIDSALLNQSFFYIKDVFGTSRRVVYKTKRLHVPILIFVSKTSFYFPYLQKSNEARV